MIIATSKTLKRAKLWGRCISLRWYSFHFRH